MATKAPHRRPSWHDAFDAQMALWRWYRSPMGRLYIQDSIRAEVNTLEHEGTRDLLRQIYGSEKTRLLDTDPIYVSAEMCEVIEAAAPNFKPEPLLETDLLTPRGFLFFERSFPVPDRFERPTTIAGASWNRLFSSQDPATVDNVNEQIRRWDGSLLELEEKMLAEDPDIEPHGIALTIYCDTTAAVHLESNEHGMAIRELYGGNVPPLVPFHLTPWYFNMTFDGSQWDEIGQPTGAEWWWRIIQTTFRLMQQRISTKRRSRSERTARRAAKRMGIERDLEVVVVRLRREQGERSEPTGEEANYSHRFIVSGFWRNQWYPSVRAHRQIWINPYIKGDPSLPLIIRPKRVYQWDR